jgi:serine/threonine protein kinase
MILLGSTYTNIGRAVDLDDPALEGIRREISLLRFIKHPTIIDYFDTFYLNNQLWLTMEYMAYG